MALTITAANSILMLSIANLYTSPQKIQGYAADDAFEAEAVEPAEVMMGVDGYQSQGYTPVSKKLTLTLQADSPSMIIFETWVNKQDIIREILLATASIALPATQRKYVFNKGVLTSHIPLPGVKKVLQPRKFTLTCESISSAAY